jgi:caffeoyl-CoA O-methyltransferase
MEINPVAITRFCTQHSTPPSSVCAELEEFTNIHAPRPEMLSGPLVGSFLGFLVSLLKTTRVLEIGTYTGYSALCMAERLPHAGKVITLDINPETARIAQAFWAKSPAGKNIELILGDAMTSLKTLTPACDLVFIDADKTGYIRYLEKALDFLSPKGIIVADNALYDGEVVDISSASTNGKAIAEFNSYIRNRADIESVLLPVRDGLMCARRK